MTKLIVKENNLGGTSPVLLKKLASQSRNTQPFTGIEG